MGAKNDALKNALSGSAQKSRMDSMLEEAETGVKPADARKPPVPKSPGKPAQAKSGLRAFFGY